MHGWPQYRSILSDAVRTQLNAGMQLFILTTDVTENTDKTGWIKLDTRS